MTLRERAERLASLVIPAWDKRVSAFESELREAVRATEDGVFKSARGMVLRERGVQTPCEKCGGLGMYTYPNTATWHSRPGMVAGQGFTIDVCNQCWGTGDKHRQGLNLEKLWAAVACFEEEYETAERHRTSKGGQQVPYHGDWCAATPSVLQALQRWVKLFKVALK